MYSNSNVLWVVFCKIWEPDDLPLEYIEGHTFLLHRTPYHLRTKGAAPHTSGTLFVVHDKLSEGTICGREASGQLKLIYVYIPLPVNVHKPYHTCPDPDAGWYVCSG